jgi:hypothetical protein
MAKIGFNAREVEPAEDFKPLPAGWYPVQITESEMLETSKKNGHYLSMVAKVIEGEFVNRQLFIRLNVDNPNEVAVRIANEQLSAICHAVNVLEIDDSEELHGIPFEIKVKVTPATDDYEAGNDVKGFRPLEGGTAGGMDEPKWDDEDEAEPETKKSAPKKSAPKKPAAKKAVKVLAMLDKEFTYEEWLETGRSDDDLVSEGLAEWVEEKAPPAKKAPPTKKEVTEEPAGDDDEPPWMKED